MSLGVEADRMRCLSFGYVRFDSLDAARNAIGAMHMQVFEGRRLALNFARANFPAAVERQNEPKAPTRTIYIGNIPFEMTDRELNDMFKDLHNLIDVRVAVDRRTGQPRGFCHAEFVDVESAQAARERLSGLAPYGRKLRLDYSQSAPGRLQRYLAEKAGMGTLVAANEGVAPLAPEARVWRAPELEAQAQASEQATESQATTESATESAESATETTTESATESATEATTESQEPEKNTTAF